MDTLVTFVAYVSLATVVLAWAKDESDDEENYRRYRAALSTLETTVVDARGRSLTVRKLYLPKPMYYAAAEIESLEFGLYQEGSTNIYPRNVGELARGCDGLCVHYNL